MRIRPKRQNCLYSHNGKAAMKSPKEFLEMDADMSRDYIFREVNLSFMDYDGIKRLIELGLYHDRLHERDEYGNTLLHIAVQRNHEELVKLIVFFIDLHDIKSDVIDIENDSGETALTVAIMNSSFESFLLLLDSEADMNAGKYAPITTAISCKCFEYAQILIDRGCNVNPRNVFAEQTPLILAVMNKNVKIGKSLIVKGADIHAVDYLYSSALHYAVKEECGEMIRILLIMDADVYSRNIYGDKPWDLASSFIRHNFLELNPLLVELMPSDN